MLQAIAVLSVFREGFLGMLVTHLKDGPGRLCDFLRNLVEESVSKVPTGLCTADVCSLSKQSLLPRTSIMPVQHKE